MSDLTRYEKELAQKLKQLPLPNEDASWEDMSKLLDENNDKGAPPFYRRNFVLGSLITALLIGSLWVAVSKYKSISNKQTIDNNKETSNTLQNHNQQQSNTKNEVPNKETITYSKEQVTTDNKTSDAPTDINKTATSLNDQKQSTPKTQLNTIKETSNNNKAQNNQQNYKERITSTKGINGNKSETIHEEEIKKRNTDDKEITDQNTDKSITHTKKVFRSNKNIKNKTVETNANNDMVSNNQSSQNEKSITKNNSLIVNNSSTKNKAKHNIIAKSGVKRSSEVSKNDATINSYSIEKTSTNDQTRTPDLTENNNTVKTNASSKTSNNNVAWHAHSIAAVSTKNNKKSFQRKNNITASTKSKTKFNITPSSIENNEDNIDTAQLIKVGTYALARKKAKQHIIKKDTSTVKPLALTAKDSSTTAKKKNDNKKQLHISVGIAEQQAIRLTCDCVYPNDAYTTSSLVTDYIPSVYVKIQPAKKWFVQAEFKYKAPQYIQEQLYKYNVSNQPLDYTTSTSVLKKVYYNQVPISFDYVIIPNLSIGVGVIYNNFAGQVSQNDVRKKLYGIAADSSISSSTETSTNGDSVLTFTKNSFQGLIEGQYEWKHFTFGARYAIGLQPYLKYNNPTSGNPTEKKNDALTVFIRFELWDSRSKKKK